jgi:hypothetical protein
MRYAVVVVPEASDATVMPTTAPLSSSHTGDPL